MFVQNIRFTYDISTLTFSLKQEEYPVVNGSVQHTVSATHDVYARCMHNGKKSSAVLCKNLSITKLLYALGDIGEMTPSEIILEVHNKQTAFDVYHVIALLVCYDDLHPRNWDKSPEEMFKLLVPNPSNKQREVISDTISYWDEHGADFRLSDIMRCTNYFPLHYIDERKQKYVCVEPEMDALSDTSVGIYNDLLMETDSDSKYVIGISLLESLCRNPRCVQRHIANMADPGSVAESGRLIDISMILAKLARSNGK